jgi:hypothetical protein
MLCMGRTFTGARTNYFIIALNMWFVSWESTPARVKASKRGAKCTPHIGADIGAITGILLTRAGFDSQLKLN